MNLPTIFNIAIGLIFIYLVLSLLASQIQEVIATLLEWRAEQLTRGIENLVLGDTDPDSEINNKNKKTYDLVDNLFRNPLIRNLNQTSKSWIATVPKKFTSWLKTIPEVIQKFILQNKEPNQNTTNPKNKELNRNTINPAYLPAETFSSTILSELDIPKAARVLTWLNAKRLIHYEIYNKIDKLLESEKITQYQKDVIKTHYEELKECIKIVLSDYKMERYGLSSTLIRLRTHIETFKRETEECFAVKKSSQSPANPSAQTSGLPTQTIKPFKTPIDKIIDFIFTPDKNDTDLVSRLRPSLTTILDLLIPPPPELTDDSETIDFIFTHEGNNPKWNICLSPSLNRFVELLKTSKTFKTKPNEDKTVNPVDQIIDFIFQPSEKNYELKKIHRKSFFKLLNYLISPPTSDKGKLKAYKIFKSKLQKLENATNLKNADDLYKSFMEVEKYCRFLSSPLAYQSFQTGLREAETNKSETEAKLKKPETDEAKLKLKLERESDLCDSFAYAQVYFKKISDILPESLRKSLYELAVRSRIKASDIDNQLDHFKQEIETWFDRSMDRASGVYKRNARGFAFLIGLVIAVSLNADTFYIVSRLSKDDALRNSIVSTSTQLVQNVQSSVNPSPTASPSTIAKSSLPINPSPTFSPSPTPKSASPAKPSPTSTLTLAPNTIERVKDNVDQSLSEITLPIGWNDNILDEQFQVPDPIKENETAEEKQNREKRNNERNRRKAQFFGHPIHPVLIMIMGWLITATAIMMGAPFWFDFLGLFINVRNTGSRPASKTDKN